LADYRDSYPEIRAAGANVAVLSVDAPEISEALRISLALPFRMLCDTERRVKEWDLYNAREMGGIAKPAVFVIGAGRAVRYAMVENTATRVHPRDLLGLLQTDRQAAAPRSKIRIPLFSDWVLAIRNGTRLFRKR
jgi:peroxiredoxin